MFKFKPLSKRETRLILFFFLLLGFSVRIIFVPYWVKIDGDLLLFSDWGIKFWQYGTKDFYFVKDWHYATPNYPPIISLVYGASYWLFDHKFYLAQLNKIKKIPKAVFIIYFYREGYWLLLKMPSILSDLGIAAIIYKLVKDFTKSFKVAFAASLFYLFIFYKLLPKLRSFVIGSVSSIALVVLSNAPFAKEVILPFPWWFLR